MKRLICFALSLLLLCSLAGCGRPAGYEELSAQPIALSDQALSQQKDKLPAIYEALSQFGLTLLRGTREQTETTALVSPLSVALALSMAANGAEGDTLAQFEEVLGGGESLDALNAACSTLIQAYQDLGGSTESSIANSLWTDPEGAISEEFIGRCQGIFDAQVISAQLSDPEIVRALNGWVSRHTDKQIPEIISEPFGEDTAILLVNALYLKNTWETEFDPDNTMERSFTHEDGSLEFLDFLRHSDVRLPYLETDAARGVLLPYDDGRLSFFALMPREGAGFDEWLDSLDGAALARLLQSPEDTQFQSLVLPKFEKQWQGDLRAVLAGLGLDLAFDPTQADFSRLGDSPAGYFLSQAIHAARIEVNEEGTEAAAATVVVTDDAGDAPPPEGLILEFTRPFLYGIVDMVNGVPLFLGTFE